ncbi:hypothetical protein [Dysgonomonas sp. ZJ709]|uniref:hypothetical protein n=1 Tax=Dysgonomonas sp. ZJ709 TaxID=2709797 RepID=UPI0013EC1B70|nr:hypothetical protein [Dysgonomonas sp. ZJ709]
MKLKHFKRLASITDYYFYKRIKQKRKLNIGRFEAPCWELRKEILRYYKSHKDSDGSFKEAIEYIKKEGMSVFPYMFRNKYDYRNIRVFRDIESDLKYVKYDAHNLFFPSEMSDKDVQICYSNLQIEQDLLSPHRYLSNTFNVSANDIFLDVGAA